MPPPLAQPDTKMPCGYSVRLLRLALRHLLRQPLPRRRPLLAGVARVAAAINNNMADHDHRAIAISTYNECWNLFESVRSADEDRNLLTLALTSRYHWLKAGGPMEWAISDWMVSRCAAAIGDGPLSLTFANSALAGVADNSPAWLQASMHEGMARASAANGDHEAKVKHIAHARALLETELSQDDRELIESQLATI